jgi:hypothetical protein
VSKHTSVPSKAALVDLPGVSANYFWRRPLPCGYPLLAWPQLHPATAWLVSCRYLVAILPER